MGPGFFGYTNEAFKILRRRKTMPNLYPELMKPSEQLKNNQPTANSIKLDQSLFEPKLQIFPKSATRNFSKLSSGAGNFFVMPKMSSSTVKEATQAVAPCPTAVVSPPFIQLVQMTSVAATNVISVGQPTFTSVLSKAGTATSASTASTPGIVKVISANLSPVMEATGSKLPAIAPKLQAVTSTAGSANSLQSASTQVGTVFVTPVVTASGTSLISPQVMVSSFPSISDSVSSSAQSSLSSRTTEEDEDGGVAPLEQVILGTTADDTSGDASALSEDAADPLSVSVDPLASAGDPLNTSADPLDINETSESAIVRDGFSSDDEADASSTSKDMANEKEVTGLLGYQLYRCAFCDFSASNQDSFRNHQISSTDCRAVTEIDSPFMAQLRLFECVHCGKRLRTASKLTEHINDHGNLKYTCALCDEKSATVHKAKMHMKSRHNVAQTLLSQVQFDKDGVYVLKPKLLSAIPLIEQPSDASTFTPQKEEITFLPQDIDVIPHRSIFSTEVRCGVCSYSTKVRTNLLRHLQFHQQEKEVPTTAPVNPVPCLEKNEKMFDKMVNLAGSSHANSSRMGGASGKSSEVKAEEAVPEFVPSHHRYACCADACNYICPEEGNLRHHIDALHADEAALKCRCTHCGVDLGAGADADAILRHLKLHGRQLYRCSRCDFVHNQRHKVERHVADVHAGEITAKVVVVRNMESEPVDSDTSQPSTSSAGAGTATSSKPSKPWRPWRCCFCKYRCQNEDSMRQHCMEKHDVDCQYKCALCSFKTNDKSAFQQHFAADHDNRPIDTVCVYVYLEDQPKEQEQNPEFDTTPLWQRDRPRVRHIRGILFDESSPPSSKSKKGSKTSSAPVTPDTSQPGPSTSRCSTPLSKGLTTPSKTSKSPTKPCKSISRQQSLTEQETTRTNLDSSIDAVVAAASAKSTSDASSRLSDKVTDIIEKCTNEIAKERDDETKFVLAKISEEQKDTGVIVIHDEDYEPTEKTDAPASTFISIKNEEDLIDSNFVARRPIKRRASQSLATDSSKMSKSDVIDLVSCEDDDYSDKSLKETFGEFGLPLHKQLKCPVCGKFKSKRISDFIFHMYKEKKIYRFKCLVCGDESITYRYMYKHVLEHTKSIEGVDEKISPLPSNPRMEAWLQLLINYQTSIICKYLQQVQCAQSMLHKIAKCQTCEKWFKSEAERNEHTMFHWSLLPYKCDMCQYSSYSKNYVEKHLETVHRSSSDNVIRCAPTISLDLQYNDGLHMDEVKANEKSHVIVLDSPKPLLKTESRDVLPKDTAPKDLDLNSVSTETVDKWIQQLQEVVQSKGAENTSASESTQFGVQNREEEQPKEVSVIRNNSQMELIIDPDKFKALFDTAPIGESDLTDPLEIDEPAPTPADLMAVSKTSEAVVPIIGDAYCCETCVFMSDSETVTEQHIRDVHFGHGKLKVLNTLKCEENSNDYVACQWCDEAGDEIRIRKHFMQAHPGRKFNIYRFSCAYCPRKFLQMAGLKMHSQRVHMQYPIRYESVKEKLVGWDFNLSAATKRLRHVTYPKQTKRYQCPMCSYCRVCGPEFLNNVRSHLRTHFKLFKCVMCDEIFSRRAEASEHQRKFHPQMPESIKTEVSEAMHEVWQSVVSTAEVVDISLPATTTSSPAPADAGLQEEDSSSASSSTFGRNVAKKSTSTPHQRSEAEVEPPAVEMDPYSYYGTEEEPLFLHNIKTKVELNGVYMDISADKLARIFDLGACVLVEDCKHLLPADQIS
ncbi:unnamed protein product [Acanthoscelides obtectus]|nr:unnamed protein product [Acanthoscelides obtectus]CAK1677154.1 Zinc finger protein 711 [Acanthoscelides obtectus]